LIILKNNSINNDNTKHLKDFKNFVMEFFTKKLRKDIVEWNGKRSKDVEIDLSKIQNIDIGLLIVINI
jgi:hypothetical protein